jgi:predicted RNA-binding protein (virulence factor B family)
LHGGSHGEILLPGRYRRPDIRRGGLVDVFVYRDSEDRLVATTETPYAMVGEFAYLRVVGINQRVGAFLDWGLDKDLLLPNREWTGDVRKGNWIVVLVRVDEKSDRIVATARINRHLDESEATYTKGQAVKLMIAGETPLGYKAIIEQKHSGLIYQSDVAEPLAVGQTLDGFILEMRPDGKIDLTIHQSGYERIPPLSKKIQAMLDDQGGSLPYHDNSTPAEIQEAFGVSKKAFKQAVGALLRDRFITIQPDGIRLAKSENEK